MTNPEALSSDLLVIHPVILCGGSGTRLWPLSRKAFPKQFIPLLGDKSLLQLSSSGQPLSLHADTLGG
jgi:mannose-1-phosphate guanylyltransferase